MSSRGIQYKALLFAVCAIMWFSAALITWQVDIDSRARDRTSYSQILKYIQLKPNSPQHWLDLARTEDIRQDRLLQDRALEIAYQLSKNRVVYLEQVWIEQLTHGDYLNTDKIARQLISIDRWDFVNRLSEVFNISQAIFGIDGFIEKIIPRNSQLATLERLLDILMSNHEKEIIPKVWSSINDEIKTDLIESGFANKIYAYFFRSEDFSLINGMASELRSSSVINMSNDIELSFEEGKVESPFCWSFSPHNQINVEYHENKTILSSKHGDPVKVLSARCYLPITSTNVRQLLTYANWVVIDGNPPDGIEAKVTTFDNNGDAFIYPTSQYKYNNDGSHGSFTTEIIADQTTTGVELSIRFSFGDTGTVNSIDLRKLILTPVEDSV